MCNIYASTSDITVSNCRLNLIVLNPSVCTNNFGCILLHLYSQNMEECRAWGNHDSNIGKTKSRISQRQSKISRTMAFRGNGIER